MPQKNPRPIHPGEFLAESLSELGVSQAALARTLGVSPMRISHFVKGNRPVTAELALLLGRAFDQSPQYWLNLQARYDLTIAEASLGRRLRSIQALKPTPPKATEGEIRAYPLRTGKIRLTKATASEIKASVGIRPSHEKMAKKVLRRLGLIPRAKAETRKL